jgi:tetratricopeptide (TPR) repeat protein
MRRALYHSAEATNGIPARTSREGRDLTTIRLDVPADLDVLETRPLDADAWRSLASNFVADGRVAEALDALACAHHLCPPRSGQTILEISKILEMLAGHAESVPNQLAISRSCSNLGFLDRAILHIELALVHEPENAVAARELAELYWKRGRYEESLDALHLVLWMSQDDVMSALLLAERLAEHSRDKSAMMIVRRIADRLPETGDAELRIGRVLRRCGALEPALARLLKAAALIPESPHAHFELALAYLELGRSADALPSLIETSRLRPEWGEPMRRLAATYRELGRIDDAKEIEHQLQNRSVTLDISEFLDLAADALGDSSELSGRLRLMPVPELLQFLAQRSSTGVLRVSSEKASGSIEFCRGSIVGAQLDGIERLVRDGDRDAHFLHCQSVLGEMIGWTEGHVDFVSGAPHESEPEIRFDVSHLLLETIRKLDEAKAEA